MDPLSPPSGDAICPYKSGYIVVAGMHVEDTRWVAGKWFAAAKLELPKLKSLAIEDRGADVRLSLKAGWKQVTFKECNLPALIGVLKIIGPFAPPPIQIEPAALAAYIGNLLPQLPIGQAAPGLGHPAPTLPPWKQGGGVTALPPRPVPLGMGRQPGEEFIPAPVPWPQSAPPDPANGSATAPGFAAFPPVAQQVPTETYRVPTDPASVAHLPEQVPMLGPVASAAPSVGDRLRQLAQLREEGLVTEEEFRAKHAALLGEL